MDDIVESLQHQVAHGPRQVPVNPNDVVEAGKSSSLVRLLIALTKDEAVHIEWARETDYADLDAAGRIGWLRADLEEVDVRIDAQLAGDGGAATVATLARSGIGWLHDGLIDALDEDATREGAAMVLARSRPEQLRPALREAEVVDDVVSMLRAAAVEQASDLWDQFLIWDDRLAEIEELDEETRADYAAQIEGAGACLAPTLFARELLMGEHGLDWLDHRRAVADFLQVYGPTDWLEVLGLLESVDGGSTEKLAATLGVAAAAGLREGPPEDDEEVAQLLELLTETPDEDAHWEALASQLGLGFQIAVGEDDFGLLLAQVAAHERLITHGIHSPGIPGLPLSATSDEDLPTADVTELVGEFVSGESTDAQTVSALRTLCDARVWARRSDEHDDLLRSVASMFEETTDPALETARAQLLSTLDRARAEWEADQFPEEPSLRRALVLGASSEQKAPEALLEMLADAAIEEETPLGMDCLRYLGDQAGREVLETLGELWTRRAPVLRAPFVRRLLEETIAVRVERQSSN
ncbi:MAG: hypothetical protein ABEN55_15415 [Bradymonadaceae bacterium]